MTGKKPLVVILGPTAVGKTQLALKLGQIFHGEIIGADSRQVYRYMDIGTAKPTTEACALVPHHLIDVVNPDENLSLAQYLRMAYQAIDNLHAQGKLPLLVGGTGQYITALIEGWNIPEVPPNEPLRQTLETFAKTHGAEALYVRLLQIDASAAEKIHPNNIRRVIRAIEVYEATGTPISVLQRKTPPPYRVRIYGLTMDRELLYERADKRVDRMIEAGLIDEVQRLLDMGYDVTLPSMSGLGYGQVAAYLQGEMGLEEAVAQTKTATHDYIRRQYTWWRGHNQGIMWHNVGGLDIAQLADDVTQWLDEQDE